jgi:UDP-N-acetylglucosamine 4,6-dehydratase/5-epimerase
MFDNKVILITGGTGSFGNAALNKFLKSNIKEIRVFSRDEKKQEDMRISYNDNKLKFYIGDVRNYQSINQAMRGVDYVFHAGALKQVPSCEFYPMEAVQTNIIGAENVLEAAFNNNVEKVVMLSTDKAVYPINAMGLSKAMMEKLMVAKSRLIDNKRQAFCATRYGNVMASRGSVIPLFISQILENKPITITDPKMTRFLMSLDDSIDLVEFAFTNANPGDIFVQKSPATTVENIALALQKIFNAKNEIKIIGTRHAEKLYETLLTREEMVKAIDMGEYYKIPADNRDLNYASYFTDGDVKTSEKDDYHSHNIRQLKVDETVEILSKLDYIKQMIK